MKWIFAYGSLLWRPDFAFEIVHKAFIYGWERRLWHLSTDHRGNSELPGRVATIVPSESGLCGGVAYGIAPKNWYEVIKYLDEREKDGYERKMLSVYLQGLGFVEAVTYISLDDENWLVPEDRDENFVHCLLNAVGESGKNIDYLLTLASTLENLDIQDQHVKYLLTLIK